VEVINAGWMEKDWELPTGSLNTWFHSPVHSLFLWIDDRHEFAVELVAENSWKSKIPRP